MKIENENFEKYVIWPVERLKKSGKNKTIWSSHRITINGEVYCFLAEGTMQWAYKNDTISFEWEWDNTKKYRNIKWETFKTFDKNGDEVIRGIRERSKPWRHRH